MAIITFLSDWKQDDYYSAIIKAKILSESPNTQIVDLNNNLPAFNIVLAAFLFRSVFSHFPKGSIHLLAINSVKEEKSELLIAELDGHYIIGNDTGIFSLISSNYTQIVKINNYPQSNFPEADIFVPLALALQNGEKLEDLGKKTTALTSYRAIQATVEDNKITGTVIYKDSYGNIIVNINKSLFYEQAKGRKFNIYLNSFHHKTTKIHEHYNEVDKRALFSIFNSIDLLEIGMRQANLSEVLNLKIGANIIVHFIDEDS